MSFMNGDMDPPIFNLGTEWRCMVLFTPLASAPIEWGEGGGVGPRTQVDAAMETKICAPSKNRIKSLNHLSLYRCDTHDYNICRFF